MLMLFEHPLSPYAQKNKIALREKDIVFELATPDAIGSGDTDSAFLRANPRGEVPALIDDGFAIFDSTIILEYLEDKWPTPPMMPDDPAQRARIRMIEDVMDTHFEAVTWGLGEVKYFRRATGERAETIRARAGEQLAGRYRWLEAQLGDAPWFTGNSFGRADLSVAPYLNAARGFGFPPSDGGVLAAWLDRVNAIPAVAETAAEAEASIASIGQAYRAVEGGGFKRHYRDHRLEWMVRTGGIDIVATGLERGDIRFTEGFD